MADKDWYYYDLKTHKYQLTELGKSMPLVAASYEAYYAPTYDEDGNIVDP